MCLLSFAFDRNSETPLIVVSNRDEFYDRATLPMHWWPEEGILAGQDQQAGGTWLGLSKQGRFAAVTNFRDLHQQHVSTLDPLSRGDLVTSFLRSALSANDWADNINNSLYQYGPFNLIIYDGKDMFYLNNQGDPKIALSSGCYALSNHKLDSPWPKVNHARSQLKSILQNGNIDTDVIMSQLITALSSEKTFPQNILPNTGIPIEWETLLSSPFIVSEGYGTRAASAVMISKKGLINVVERGFHNGAEIHLNTFSYEVLDTK
ncbi:MAG: NRDE family protein [Porticoccaceae bacterium]|nr:NRDE family protein [Porticoccaceae bacterium]MDG1474561.1 NRDE family protein [Porticoccaceae bacterium]